MKKVKKVTKKVTAKTKTKVSTRRKPLRLSKKKLQKAIMDLQLSKISDMVKDAKFFSDQLVEKKKEFEAVNKEAWFEQRKRLTEANPSPRKYTGEKERFSLSETRAKACLIKLQDIIHSSDSALSKLEKAYEYLDDFFGPLPELIPNMLEEACPSIKVK